MNKILILLFLSVSIFASGQEDTWPLQRCVSAALENSIDIKIKQLEVLRTQKLYTHPLFELFPSVSLSGNHSYNFGSTIDPTTNARVSSDIQWDNFYLNANMNLLDFNTLALSAKEKIAVEISKADKAAIEYEYKLELLEKYSDALFSQELVRIQQEQLQNTIFNRDRIEKEVGIGNKPQSDLYDIQLSFSQDEKRLIEAKQLFESQKLQLFQLMNVKDVALEQVLLEIYFIQEPVGEILILANPQIQLAELQFKSSTKETALLRAANLPVLSAFYSMSSFYSSPINQPGVTVAGFQNQLDDNKNHQLGLQIAIPVFNGFRKSKQISASRVETDRTKLVVEQQKLKVQQQIELEAMKRRQYEELTANLQNTLKYAKESFKTTQSKFSNGKIDAVIYTSVKNQLLSSEYDFLKNKLLVQYASAKINLIQNNQL